jgi:hypothetical protein
VDNILLWVSRLLLLWLNRLLLLWLNMLHLLWLNRLLLLTRGTMGCQMPDDKMISSALVSGTMNVNHVQFRDRRV